MTAPAGPLVAALVARGQTVATAESLTAGLVADALVQVPGSSAAYRGGVIAYATGLKQELLGVDAALLGAHGPVHPEVAEQMAAGARRRLAATWGVATTGVAGPDPQDGHDPGEVYVAVCGPGGAEVARLRLAGGRPEVRAAAAAAALDLLLHRVLAHPEHPGAAAR